MRTIQTANHGAEQRLHPQGLRRRGLVAGAAGLLGGWLVARLGRPAVATADSNTALLIGVGANQPTNVADKTGLVIANGNTLSPCVLQADNTSTSPGTPPPGGVRAAIVGTVAGADTTSNARMGVFGQADTSSGYGVYGAAATGIGVVGSSVNGEGVYGYSAGGSPFAGVIGYGANAGTTAIIGVGLSGGSAGSFVGAVTVSGNFTVVNGTKSAAVKASDGSYKLLYTLEAPESWFEDVGQVPLVAGKATVPIPADFAPFIQTTGYLVFLTPEGDTKGLYVTNKTATNFDIHENQGGASSTTVTYRLMAKRKDVTAARLAPVTIPRPHWSPRTRRCPS